jgi:pseudaminic acid cytidylyltransferase
VNEAIAIIPARGGSNRIPRKNIREFHGKPIIAYSIDAARHSKCFERIVVSTDDDEIAAVAQEFGAEVPFRRPPSLADAHTGTIDVVKHAVDTLEASGITFEWTCCIYATAPFLSADCLAEGFRRLRESGRSFAFSVARFEHPIQRALRILADGSLDAISPEHRDSRSQDLEPSFHDAGQFYWGRTCAFKERRKLFSSESIPIVLPHQLAHDIDTPEDWANAELAFAALRLSKGHPL